MEVNQITKKGLIGGVVLSLLMLLLAVFQTAFDHRTTIVFCDVGQGDAAYIRIKNKIDILIDAGPDKKVLTCLGRYMPFYDRQIELVIISHGQKDHCGGLSSLLERYRIAQIVVGPAETALEKLLAEKKIPVSAVTAGSNINLLDDEIRFYWPAKPAGNILGTATTNNNRYSLVFSFQEKNVITLFTGDAPADILDKIPVRKISILKVPHHGSKNGLSQPFFRLADPTVAVISVGAKNSYGHPAKEVIDTLEALGTKIRRTDKEGAVVFRLN